MEFQTKFFNRYDEKKDKDFNLSSEHCSLFEDTEVMSVGDQVLRFCNGFIPISNNRFEEPDVGEVDDPSSVLNSFDDPSSDHIVMEQELNEVSKKIKKKSKKEEKVQEVKEEKVQEVKEQEKVD